MWQKCIAPQTAEAWLQSSRKSFTKASIICKAKALAFPLVGRWLVWKVGVGTRTRIREDPWAGCDENFKLPRNMVEALQERGLFYLH
jgi:hypothetical protein